jgi:N-acetylmuramoyl-L-alanine amidase
MKNFYIISTVLFIMLSNSIPTGAENIKENVDSINLYEEKEEIVQVFNNSTHTIQLTENDIYLMAQVVYAESRAEPFDGKVAVASVILNRVLHPEFPKTVEGVVKQKGAFSCIRNGKIDVIPNSECYNAVLEAIKGKDPTNRAVFFYNPRTATSKWMKNISKDNVTPIGNHVFFVVNK